MAGQTGAGARAVPRAEPTRWPEVVAEAARLFYEQGYESTSVNDLARALKITKGSLYHYVSSKEELLFAIIDQMHALTVDLLASDEDRDGDALQRLWRYFVGHVRLNTDNLYATTLIYRDFDHLSGERRGRIVAIRDELEANVRDLIAEAIREGLAYPGTDVHLASIQMFVVANGIYRWYRPAGTQSPEDVSRTVATFAVRGIASGPWSPPTD
jgi:AcrR family transcriptional regulator